MEQKANENLLNPLINTKLDDIDARKIQGMANRTYSKDV